MSAIARSADGLSVRWEMICSKISCGKIGRSVGVLGLVVRVEVAFTEHAVSRVEATKNGVTLGFTHRTRWFDGYEEGLLEEFARGDHSKMRQAM